LNKVQNAKVNNSSQAQDERAFAGRQAATSVPMKVERWTECSNRWCHLYTCRAKKNFNS